LLGLLLLIVMVGRCASSRLALRLKTRGDVIRSLRSGRWASSRTSRLLTVSLLRRRLVSRFRRLLGAQWPLILLWLTIVAAIVHVG
jgi:hypothetical protein